MKKYWISRTKDNAINFGQTEWDGIINSPDLTFETFDDETTWKKQISHYQSIYPQIIDMDLPIDGEDLFPFPELNIRVQISHYNVSRMQKSPYKPLIEMALLCTHTMDEACVTIWLSRLENETMSAEAVRGTLESFGAQILTK